MKMAACGMKGHVFGLLQMETWELSQYAHENGCPWNENVCSSSCSSAAKNGHMKMVTHGMSGHAQELPKMVIWRY